MSQLGETQVPFATKPLKRVRAVKSSLGPRYSVFAAEVASLRRILKRGAVVLLHDEAAADDLVQDTLERALVKQSSFRAGTNLKAWVNSIMHNLFIDGWRRPELRCQIPADQVACHREPEPRNIDPIDILVSADVIAAMADLPARAREIFELAYFRRAGYRAISTCLGIHTATIGTSLFRTKAKLRKALFATYLRRVASSHCAELSLHRRLNVQKHPLCLRASSASMGNPP